jgi:hypothetical protein
MINDTQIMIVLALFLLIVGSLYTIVGWGKVGTCMRMWKDRSYWTDYNTIEFAAWFAKGAIIIPGLVFHVEIWELHLATLVTSSLLIWASMRKGLPTLLAFNTMWIMLSLIVVVRNIT